MHPPPVDGEHPIASAVGFEGRVGVVERAAVELDDEAVLGPDAVGLDAEGADLHVQAHTHR
jgi:hypothetical protein